MQNAVLEILSEIILEEITDEIREAEYFTLLVDKTKDLSKTEQLAFVIKYTYECDVHEEFIGFRATEDINAESLSHACYPRRTETNWYKY